MNWHGLELAECLHLDLPTGKDVEMAEKALGLRFPTLYCEALLHAAGRRPLNLAPVAPDGTRLGFGCFYHIFMNSDEPHEANVGYMEARGYGQRLLMFADDGESLRYCLDYRFSPVDSRLERSEPQVVMVLPAIANGDERAIIPLAESFEEFLDRFTQR